MPAFFVEAFMIPVSAHSLWRPVGPPPRRLRVLRVLRGSVLSRHCGNQDQSVVHSVNDDTSLMKIRFPEITGCVQVAVAASAG